jgi:periplasmic protein TonB
MTFQRSLFISFGIHILLFGSALAFAQYAYVLGRSDTITVMLVGPGSASEKGPVKVQVMPDSEPGRSQKSAHPQEVLSRDDVERIQIASQAPNVSRGDGQTGAEMTKTAAGKSASNGTLRGETGSQFGIITPDQWQIIQAALERAKDYPRMARERGIEGVVQVRFRVLPSGNVERVEILKSSGSEILDAASVRTVYRSGPLPSVSGWVEVPISYSIVK